MRIGIDMDGVLADDDRNRLDTLGKYLYENNLPEMDKPYAYEIKCSNMSFQNENFQNYRMSMMWDYWEDGTAFRYSDEVTQKLHEEGHEIYIITGRSIALRNDEVGQRLRDASLNWLKNHHIYFDKLIFSPYPKVKTVLENEIDLMIEDFNETILDCSKHIPTFVFDNRYNVGLEGNNITRVFSWYDIYRKIKENNYKGAK